jgi:hypothetical protein
MRAAGSRPLIPYGKRILSPLRRALGVAVIASLLQAIPQAASQPSIPATDSAPDHELNFASPTPSRAVTTDAPNGTTRHTDRTDGGLHPSAFGFLVFDWDPAQGDIPGFGPLDAPPTNSVIADAAK